MSLGGALQFQMFKPGPVPLSLPLPKDLDIELSRSSSLCVPACYLLPAMMTMDKPLNCKPVPMKCFLIRTAAIMVSLHSNRNPSFDIDGRGRVLWRRL